ncbi:hypothetical protein D3C87_1904540 [compost metagenome]
MFVMGMIIRVYGRTLLKILLKWQNGMLIVISLHLVTCVLKIKMVIIKWTLPTV